MLLDFGGEPDPFDAPQDLFVHQHVVLGVEGRCHGEKLVYQDAKRPVVRRYVVTLSWLKRLIGH